MTSDNMQQARDPVHVTVSWNDNTLVITHEMAERNCKKKIRTCTVTPSIM